MPLATPRGEGLPPEADCTARDSQLELSCGGGQPWWGVEDAFALIVAYLPNGALLNAAQCCSQWASAAVPALELRGDAYEALFDAARDRVQQLEDFGKEVAGIISALDKHQQGDLVPLLNLKVHAARRSVTIADEVVSVHAVLTSLGERYVQLRQGCCGVGVALADRSHREAEQHRAGAGLTEMQLKLVHVAAFVCRLAVLCWGAIVLFGICALAEGPARDHPGPFFTGSLCSSVGIAYVMLRGDRAGAARHSGDGEAAPETPPDSEPLETPLQLNEPD
eukprot:TRINITY_DN22127_c0_g1_i1.p1 TRINITY_DN22127_c0_g1~~TRINITY_DN22127_c0_g1_i1.p1  ORF type:complete len:279 (+),score=58.96 TRINITY_DN22127_c0_g1_i1:112-948(+)